VSVLALGNYTAIVRSHDGTSGVALVEVYNLPQGSGNIASSGSIDCGQDDNKMSSEIGTAFSHIRSQARPVPVQALTTSR